MEENADEKKKTNIRKERCRNEEYQIFSIEENAWLSYKRYKLKR